ncbi:MAG: hypothetical protein II017_03565, partial [Erysipelotrichaceae bacterium]|nr:hypothetical protein [Erysipelotrichaceae bacterium]
MAQLPSEVGKLIDKMEVGDISQPFVMVNPKTRREQVAIVKLNKRIEGHKADLAEDYQTLKGLYENRKKADVIYEAAVSLLHYTEGLEGEAAEKVYEFAKQAIEYVKTMYGEKIDDPAYNFPKLAGDASKWTLSLWNELIKLLNL